MTVIKDGLNTQPESNLQATRSGLPSAARARPCRSPCPNSAESVAVDLATTGYESNLPAFDELQRRGVHPGCWRMNGAKKPYCVVPVGWSSRSASIWTVNFSARVAVLGSIPNVEITIIFISKCSELRKVTSGR